MSPDAPPPARTLSATNCGPTRWSACRRIVASAAALAQHDRYQFEWWGRQAWWTARPAKDRKKGAGRRPSTAVINFFDDKQRPGPSGIVVQVKSGQRPNRGMIATLKGDMETGKRRKIGLFRHPERKPHPPDVCKKRRRARASTPPNTTPTTNTPALQNPHGGRSLLSGAEGAVPAGGAAGYFFGGRRRGVGGRGAQQSNLV